MKRIPNIQPIYEFESAVIKCWAARTHVPGERFAAVLQEKWNQSVDPQKARQEYWRNVPRGGGMISVPCQPGRGAYEVTVADAEDVRAIAGAEQ